MNDSLALQDVIEDLRRWIAGHGVIALAAQLEHTTAITELSTGDVNLNHAQHDRIMFMHEIMSAVVEKHGIVAARNWFLNGPVIGLGHGIAPRDAIRDGHFNEVKLSARRFIGARTPHPLDQ